MRLSCGAKAIFFIVNHVIAAHGPPETLRASKIHNHPEDDTNLEAREDPALILKEVNIWKGCCQDKCPAGKIYDPKDCTVCSSCPKGQQPNKEQTKCVKFDDKKKQEKYEAKRKQKYKEYKTKGYDKWKEIKRKEYDKKMDNKKRNKVRRMGRCLMFVPLAMGGEVVDNYADTFDEEWAESMELLEFWPADLELAEWTDEESDAFFEGEDYINSWVDLGNAQKRGIKPVPEVEEIEKVSPFPSPVQEAALGPSRQLARNVNNENIPNAFVRKGIPSSKALVVRHGLEPRAFPFLIPIFAAIAAAARVIARVVSTVTSSSMRIAKGTNKISRKKKKDSTVEISENKNWRNCLQGYKPSR